MEGILKRYALKCVRGFIEDLRLPKTLDYFYQKAYNQITEQKH